MLLIDDDDDDAVAVVVVVVVVVDDDDKNVRSIVDCYFSLLLRFSIFMFQYFLLSFYKYTCTLCCCTLNLDNGTLMNTVVIRSIKYFILDMLNY